MKLRLVTLVAAAALSSLALAPAMAANYSTSTPAATAPAAGSMMSKPAARMAKTMPDAKRFTSVSSAQASCPTDTIVWSNTKSKIFHLSGTATFGKGTNSTYMCETAAKAEGFVPTKKPEKMVSSAK